MKTFKSYRSCLDRQVNESIELLLSLDFMVSMSRSRRGAGAGAGAGEPGGNNLHQLERERTGKRKGQRSWEGQEDEGMRWL